MSYGNYGWSSCSLYRPRRYTSVSLGSLTGSRYDYLSDRLARSDYSQTERSRQRYGSSSSIPGTASETSSRSDISSHCSSVSHTGINEEKNKEYLKLYEEMKKENEELKETLKKTEDELERTKNQLQKFSQNYVKSSLNEAEKKERRSLERRISEMEEEIKNVAKLKNENEKLKAENRALSRMVCKLSK